MRWIVAAGLATLAIVAALAVGGPASSAPGPAPVVDARPAARGDAPSPLTAAVRDGHAVRIDGAGGPIHVWRPAGYRPETAATVVYVHGYYVDVDTAWRDHQLPEQFAASAVNALFIAPEAPSGARQEVPYPDLGALVRTVEDALGEPRPSGPLVVVAHSGAYRVVLRWIEYPLLDTVMMIDSLYGDLGELRDWLAAGPARRLVTVGDDTVRWTEDFARSIPDTVEIDRIPSSMDQWPSEARTARHLYVRSQLSHMAQVTGDLLIPMLLRLEPVELLASAPWDHPFGDVTALPDAAPAPPRRRR